MNRAPTRLPHRQLNPPAASGQAQAIGVGNVVAADVDAAVSAAVIDAKRRVVLRRVQFGARDAPAAGPFVTLRVTDTGGSTRYALRVSAGAPTFDSGPLYIPCAAGEGLQCAVEDSPGGAWSYDIEWDVETLPGA